MSVRSRLSRVRTHEKWLSAVVLTSNLAASSVILLALSRPTALLSEYGGETVGE
jgi:hypothetical protein